MSKKILRVGLIGYGFMGRAHSNAFRQVSSFFDTGYELKLQAVCGRDLSKVAAFAAQWGYESHETDWRKMIERDDIDVIDIAVPNNLHAEIAIAAAKAGKIVWCEKPLGFNADSAEQMVAAVEAAKVGNMVWYNYRRIPAVVHVRNLIDAGFLGKVFHYRAKFLQDWTISPELPQGGAGLWRLDLDAAGSGVTGDLLAHCVDTAIWLNGGITDLTAMSDTFITERTVTGTTESKPVRIDDATAFLARFSNGSQGTFESTRYARGHKALYTFEINGENGSVAWDLHDLNRLSVFDHRDPAITRGWKSIHMTDREHPFMAKWWVPGLSIGYEHSFIHQVADFLFSLRDGQAAAPTFRHALATDYVVAAVHQSAGSRAWVQPKDAALFVPQPVLAV